MNNLLIIVLCLFSSLAFGKEVHKKNPILPDVWGYDLSEYAEFNGGDPSITVMLAPNNDLAFRFTSYLDMPKSEARLIGFKFFDGNKIEIDGNNSWAYTVKYKLRPPGKPQNWILFKDESLIVFDCKAVGIDFMNDMLRYCSVKKGPHKPGEFYEEHEMEEYSIFSIERIVKDGKLTNDFNICPFTLDFRDLKDDTFITYEPHCSLIIRFDKNLKTKFKPRNTIDLGKGKILQSNFFILPYEKVLYFYENVAQGYEGKLTPEITRQFLDYLYEEQENDF